MGSSLNRWQVLGLCLFTSFSLQAKEFVVTQPVDNGLRLNHQTVEILQTNYLGFGENWQWAGTQFTTVAENHVSADVPTLDLHYERITEMQENQLVQYYRFVANEAHPNAVGYGLSFKLNLQSPSFQGMSGTPELLADNAGWRWQTTDNSAITVRFSPAPKRVFFEGSNPGEIRALFFEAISPGNYDYTMTVSFDGEPPPEVSFTSPALTTTDWPVNTQSWQTTAVDLSFLNNNHKPAGQHGHVKAVGEDLFFGNGEPARFWGTNVSAYALFITDDSNIQLQAKRLAKLGFNLVRIHHHDSKWVTPNIFENPTQNTRTLNELALKKLDLWIKSLQDEGIYIWLDLQVERPYTANDGILLFQEAAKGQLFHHLKGFNYYDPDIQERMIEFNTAYLSHINSHTGLAYQDDPAIIGVTLTNENDLSHHFGNALQADKNVPEYHQIFQQDVASTVDRLGLDSTTAWQTWTFGDAKIYLNDAEHRFNEKIIAPLNEAGLEKLIITTNTWGGMSLTGLPSLTDGDVIDVHSYGRANEVEFNPRFRGGMLAWIGAGQVTDKPLVVTEWTVEKFPVEDRHVMPAWLAAIASLQGWDAPMLYGYSQSQLNALVGGSNYDTYNDPSLMAMMPAAALLFRQQHLKIAQKHYRLRLPPEVFFGEKITPDNSATIRTLLEQSKLTIDVSQLEQLPWLDPQAPLASGKTEPTIISDPHRDYIPVDQQFVIADTGQIKRNWESGVLTIDSPQSQILSGNISLITHQLSSSKFSIETESAVVAVQSMTEQPITDSSEILISKIGRSMPEDQQWNSPFVVEPIIGTISIKAPEGLNLYSLNSNGDRQQLDVEYNGCSYKI
ncbi:MAG TPA: hypothetical protein VK999_03495, partial [Methylotenera sp.]|nr:hypothetical protein [Methylotenera sp.]